MTAQVLIGLLSCRRHKDRDLLSLDTWITVARSLGMRVVFLVGDGAGRWPAFLDGDYLHCPCPDTYPALPQKSRAFFRWALTQPGWDVCFKADNDTLVIPSRLAAYDFTGKDYVGCEPGGQFRGWASGGAGYALSRRAVELAAQHLNARVGAEDKLVGRIMARCKIAPTWDPRFIPFGNEQRRPLPDNEAITTHKISEALWRETWDRFTTDQN